MERTVKKEEDGMKIQRKRKEEDRRERRIESYSHIWE